MDAKNPFDLSSAIELLRSIPSYPAAVAFPETQPTSDGDDDRSCNTLADSNAAGPRYDIPDVTGAGMPDSLQHEVHPLSSAERTTNLATTHFQGRLWAAHPAGFSFDPTALQKLNLIEKLAKSFSDIGPFIKFPESLTESHPSPIHVFVDHSNISIAFSESWRKSRDYKKTEKIRLPTLSFPSLALILERGRRPEKKVLVGSSRSSTLVSSARELGYEVNILRRVPRDTKSDILVQQPSKLFSSQEQGKKNKEQCVDEIIIMKMLESLVDYRPSTIVLATGDGNITDFSDGFFKTVERFLSFGWMVELVAFQRSLSKSWKKLHSSRFRVVVLDEYLDDLSG